MTAMSEAPCGPLRNHLGWQGWQLDLPADWNPARLSGSAGAGTLVVVDLERPRLELSWRRVRSPGRVDLSRVAKAGTGRPGRWRIERPGREGIAELRHTVADDGDVVALVLSEASARLAFVKIAGLPGRTVDSVADRILGSVADASGRPLLPWCVYGFAWSVPAGFRLAGHRFAAGRVVLGFRRRRRRITFERWALAGLAAERAGPTCGGGAAEELQLDHHGHAIRAVRAGGRKLWERILGGESWQAEWNCQHSRRGYRVQVAGPDAADLLRTGVRGVVCHRSTTTGPGADNRCVGQA